MWQPGWEGSLEEVDACMCMTESLWCPPETITTLLIGHCCYSVAKLSDSLWLHGLQHARLPHHSLPPRVCSNSCPLSWWCQPTISSCVALFSSGLQFFPAYIPQYIPQYKTEVRKNSGFSQTVALFKISRVNTFTHVSSSVTVFQKFLQKLSQLILTATPPRATQIDGQKSRDSPVTSGGHPGRLGHLHPDPLSTLLYTKKA